MVQFLAHGPAFRMLIPMFALAACAAPSDEDLDLDTSADALVSAHVYKRPATPTANYPAPSTNAIYVATTGNDTSGNGSASTPYKTLAKALAVANAKAPGPLWTIVVKSGTYREGRLNITRDNVAIQRYQSDKVSILGSTALAGFTGAGPYKLTISSVSTTALEQNCADTHLNRTNGSHANPEQPFAIMRAGVPLRRAAVGTTLATSEYSYDAATNVLTLHDSPTEIELATQLYAFMTKASNVKLAGLDIEGYATCAVDWKKRSRAMTTTRLRSPSTRTHLVSLVG